MNKREIFNKILQVTAEVCDVEEKEILDGNRKMW